MMMRTLWLVGLLGMTTALQAAWTQDYEAAKKQARLSNRPILAMFTGSDWCPPCKQFDREVAHSERFLGFTKESVVLLKIDFPQHKLQAPALIAQNEALAERIGGEEFPRFYLLDADGRVLGKLNTRVQRRAADYVDFILQALREELAKAARRPAKE